MTREEAIKILKELAGYEKTMDLIQNYSVSVQDALYMAIKELEQEPCEDAISRQEMLKYFENWKNQIKYYHPYAKNFDIPYEEAIQRIKDVPPVKCVSSEKSNKTGHWIFDEILYRHYYCSECKAMGVDYWDYCPNCGARMVGPQESEDKDADKKCTYKETGCGSCKRQLDCPIEADKAESEDKA